VLAASYTQHYTPVADNVVSALVAALPIIVLLGLLGLFRVKAHLAALAGLAASLLVAMVVFGTGTLHRVRFSLLTIAAMLVIGYVTRYGGWTRAWAWPSPRPASCSPSSRRCSGGWGWP
jgi:L-lactate permease